MALFNLNPLTLFKHRWGKLVFCALSLMCAAYAHAYFYGSTQKLLAVAMNRFGVEAQLRMQVWLKEAQLLSQRRDLSPTALLSAVNRLANQLPYLDDLSHWGAAEYWATPTEFVASNGGDCEDYAITKYFLLRELGISVSQLRMTYVQAWFEGKWVSHMVLTYYPSETADPLVLDNINPQVLPARARSDLIPVYTFNDASVWKINKTPEWIGKSSQLTRWEDLLRRMRLETGQ